MPYFKLFIDTIELELRMQEKEKNVENMTD